MPAKKSKNANQLSDSVDTSADSTKLVIAEDSDEGNTANADLSGVQNVVTSKRTHSSSDSSLEESFENLPIEKKSSSENIFGSPTRNFNTKSNSKNRRSARSQKGTPLKKLKLDTGGSGKSKSEISTTEKLEVRKSGRQNVRSKETTATKKKLNQIRSNENTSESREGLKEPASGKERLTDSENVSSSAKMDISTMKKSELTWSSLDESSDDATREPISGKSRSTKAMHSAALPQSKNNLSDETDSELSDDTLAEQTLAIDSDSISQVKSPLMGYKDMSSKELWKTPKTMKICKSKERPSTIKSLSRNRSVSPVESIASSRGRRSLIRTKLNFDENSDDGSNTDDFFEETLSDYQPSSGSDKNNRNSADSKKKVSYYRKKTKSKDTDFEEDDHQRLDVSKSKSTKMKRGPYKKKSKHVRSKDDKNTSQAFISDEISSDSEIENNKTMSQRKNGRKIKRKESPLIRSEARDGLHSIASTSECTVSQEIDKISGIPELDELDVVESSDESNTNKVTTSLMSKKRFKKPWNLDSSEIMTSDDSDEAVQIDTESVNWMNEGELNDLEKDKSVFDNIESSETDSDVEEIEESVTSGKSKGVRKFSDWQKNKRKLLQEIVGWLPLNRNPVSILIETLRDKILKKEYDRIDDILKALMMKIASKSKVRSAHGIEASMLAMLVPVIFCQMPSLVNQKTIRQFEKEDQDALIKYLVQSVIKRNEFNMEPFTNSLKRLTLDNADCEKTQEKILSDTIQDILKVFSKTHIKSRRSGEAAIASEDHRPNVQHHVFSLQFQLDYLQVKTNEDAQALAEKIIAKVENTAVHQRVGLQTLNRIMKKLEDRIEDGMINKWYDVLAETSYTGARKHARRKMKVATLEHEFENNKDSDAGFSLAKVFAENGEIVKSLKTWLDYWGRNRVKCDSSLVVWEFLRSLLNEQEAFEWLKQYRGFGSPVQFRKVLLKYTTDHPVEIISLKKEILNLF